MAQPIPMPKMGQSEENCTLVKWRKKEGDKVAKGDILFEIETDKAVLEIESFFEGTLLKILTPEGTAVPVGTPVAFLGQPGEKVPDVATPLPAAQPHPATSSTAEKAPTPALSPVTAAIPAGAVPAPLPAVPATPIASAPTTPAAPARQAISPRAKALIRNSAISPLPIRGTGPGGRIVEKDVQAYLDSKAYANLRISPAAKALAIKEGIDVLSVRGTADGGRIVTRDIETALRERPRPMSRMRQVIAQRLTQSVHTAPHFYVSVSVDMTELMAYRKELKDRGIAFTVTDFILESVILALLECPIMNSTTDGRNIRWSSAVHLGLATSLEDGLVVPVIRNAETLTLRELHDTAAGLAGRAREGKLRPDEMAGSTFTVSNLGMMNVENFIAIINPPEPAILAVASTVETPVVRDGKVVVRAMMRLTLSSDHRIIDGSVAAQFINAIKNKLEDLRLWKSLTLS